MSYWSIKTKQDRPITFSFKCLSIFVTPPSLSGMCKYNTLLFKKKLTLKTTQVLGKRRKANNTKTAGMVIWCWSRLPHASG